jgi:hypothetical protein
MFPLIRDAFMQYEPCDMFIDICKVLRCEADVAESKYVVMRGCDCSDIFAMGVTELVKLPVDRFHINLNNYHNIWLISVIFCNSRIE